MSQSSTAQTRDVALASGETVLLRWAGATDTGRRRENNQDSFLAQFPLFVVADGMGGHAGGAVTAETIEAALIAAVDDITAHPETTDEGTGTTLTGVFFALVDGDARWVSLNIGDSRVYLLRDGALSQITTDHSVVQELITAGRLSPEEAEGHPYSNVITRAVGVSEALPPDYRELSVQDGDRFVICSDGLTKELTDYGIQHFLGLHPTADAAADAMMSAALENGGRDNVTLIVIDIARRGPGDESEETSSTAELPTE